MEIWHSENDIRLRIPLPVYIISDETMRQILLHVRHTSGPVLYASIPQSTYRAAGDETANAKMIGERAELVAIGSLAGFWMAFHGVEQHQKLTLNAVLLHRPLFTAEDGNKKVALRSGKNAAKLQQEAAGKLVSWLQWIFYGWCFMANDDIIS